MIKLLYSETDDEKDEKDDKEEPKEEVKKPEAPQGPSEWNCPICTFINEMENATCICCEAGQRPSREELEREFKAALEQSKQEAKEQKELEKEQDADKKESLVHTRLRLLARDIRHMISHDQREVVLKKLEAEKAKK